VECLGAVARRFPAARLVCAGTGTLASQMQRRAEELGVADRLHLLGNLDLSELPPLLASSDLILAAHMGYTLVEAGLTGVPIVTYDYDFHGEVISDGETGFLAPLRDVNGLAEQACRVLEDRAAARAAGQRLRARLLRDHSLDAVVPL
jgi:glycosyltransferase involved in cell wall biosynthesis